MVVHRAPVPASVEVRVIFVESPTAVRVLVGPGVGQLDGGLEQTWDAKDVPIDLRRPGAVFWMTRPGR